jgi:hypothetical protein
MSKRSFTAAMVIAGTALMVVNGTKAESVQYPDWGGQWERFVAKDEDAKRPNRERQSLACSAFTHVTACTLAPSPIRDALYRRLQPLRCLHSCSGCFRLERSPGGTCMGPSKSST